MLLPTRVSMPAVTGLRNLPFVAGTAITFTYPVELKREDLTVGMTLVSAAFDVGPGFGLASTLTKSITSTISVTDGWITDTAADGVGSFYFTVSALESAAWTTRKVFVVSVIDSLGRTTVLDAGFLVPVTSAYVFAAVDRVIIAPTHLSVNLGATGQMAAVAVDEDGTPLTDRIITRTTSAPGVVTVATTGVITPVGVGTVSIEAEADGISAFSSVIVAADLYDSFDRLDSTTAIGVADTGQTWVVLSAGSVFGIIDYQAYLVTAGGANADVVVIDAVGRSDATVALGIGVMQTAGLRLAFRFTDSANGFIVDSSPTSLDLYRRQAGSYFAVGSVSGLTVAGGDVLSAVFSGASITISQNGVSRITGSDAFQSTATKHGIASNQVDVGRFASFSVA